ncbi:MAG: response regulator [Proteobacteria bacterium]|nr:response regulator [Pseudomonadota bacterium]MCP4916484.1 response regulator [Pseudomonadota bacterium]
MRVLIVDDNVGFARLLRDQLRPERIDVAATPDPSGARASARANRPDVLVVNAELPDDGCAKALDGIAEVLKKPAHVLLVTERSPTHEDVQALAERYGASHVAQQPLPMLGFVDILERALKTPAGLQPTDRVPAGEKPKAPWEQDPNWGLERPRPQVRTTVPVRGDPTLTRPPAPAERGDKPRPLAPWEKDPAWGAEKAPPKPKPAPATTTFAASFAQTPEEPSEPPRLLNVSILRKLTRVWARRLAGTVTAKGHPGSAAFADGAPNDVMSEIFVQEALESRLELKFSETRSESNNRRLAFSKLLWRTAIELADPDFILRHGDKALEDCAFPAALEELPVHRDVKRLAESADPYLSVHALLDALNSTNSGVGEQLSALERLGLFKFASVRKAKASKKANYRRALETAPMPDLVEDRRGRRSGRVRAGDDERGGRVRAQEPVGPPPSAVDHSLMIERLRRERDQLARADAWIVLGIPPTEDRGQIRSAADRMLYRYHGIMDDPENPDEAREIAEEIAAMVDAAIRNAKPIGEEPDLVATKEEQVFEQGRRGVRLKDWDMAVKCFRTALKGDLNNARYMGWQGWAQWRLAEQKTGADQARLRDDGLEMMRLSDCFDTSDDDVQMFLAQAELDSGILPRAKGRAARVKERTPMQPGVDMLLQQIHRAIAAQERR